MSVPLVPLNDGRAIPQIGLGVYKIGDDEAARTVATALEAGYRHIDTATLYGNERGVGEGIRASGLPREQVFVTTKVWNDDHGFDETLEAFDRSLELLGTDYVDLYLVHWPIPSRDRYVDTYRALERLRQAALAGDNLFDVLMDAVRCCSLGEITHTLFEVGGRYRRNV